MTDEPVARSAEACPRCGAHRLATVEPPNLVDFGAQPLDEIFMVRWRSSEPVAPGIECLACGATWRDLDAFRADSAGEIDHDPA